MDEPTTPTTAGMAPARRQQFEDDIAQLRIRTGVAGAEPRYVAAGAALMAVGALVGLIALIASLSMADTRDVISMLILALVGLTVAVGGAALFLRYSLGRFLRFWLLRLIYEQQEPAKPSTD